MARGLTSWIGLLSLGVAKSDAQLEGTGVDEVFIGAGLSSTTFNKNHKRLAFIICKMAGVAYSPSKSNLCSCFEARVLKKNTRTTREKNNKIPVANKVNLRESFVEVLSFIYYSISDKP